MQAIPPKRAAFAAGLLPQGRSVLDVAGVLAFAPRWVEELAAPANAHGPNASGGQRQHNRAAGVLTADLLKTPAERLRAPPKEDRPPRSVLSSFHPPP